MHRSNPAPSIDNILKKHRSDICRHVGPSISGSNSETRREARTLSWRKRSARRAERRNDKRCLRALLNITHP